MNINAVTLPRRYPGLKPFERNQQAVFHGRQEDVSRLSNLILRERLVVLFAKSGIGKTSLLQAGVAPELERRDFVPIMLRTERTDKPLVEAVSAVWSKAPELSGRDTTGERNNVPQTLWEQLKRALRTQKAGPEALQSQFGFNGITFRPQPCAIATKVIIIGPHELYAQLLEADSDFASLF